MTRYTGQIVTPAGVVNGTLTVDGETIAGDRAGPGRPPALHGSCPASSTCTSTAAVVTQ